MRRDSGGQMRVQYKHKNAFKCRTLQTLPHNSNGIANILKKRNNDALDLNAT